jgi:hypothetical protein
VAPFELIGRRRGVAVLLALLLSALAATLVVVERPAAALHVTTHCTREIYGYCAGGLVGPLAVSGRQIVDRGQANVPVLLQGAMFEGPGWLKGQPDYNPIGFPDKGALTTLEAWNVNFVRLTLSADIWNAKCSEPYRASYPNGYRAGVRNAVSQLTSDGIYVVLTLYTSNPDCALDGPTVSGTAPLPGRDAIPFWKEVAAEFADNPLVGFEPWNEPEICATGPKTAKPIGTVSACTQPQLDAGWAKSLRVTSKKANGGTLTYQDVGMSRLYAVIHDAAPKQLIFLDANGWAAQTATYQHLPASMRHSTKLVYALHPYDCQDKTKAGAASVAACRDETPEECATIMDRIVNSDTDQSTGARLSRPVVFDEIGFPEGEQAYYAPHTINGVTGYYPISLVQKGLYLYNFIAQAQARSDGFAVFSFANSDTGDSWNGPYLLTRQPIAPGDPGPWHPSPDGTSLIKAGTGPPLSCIDPPEGFDTWLPAG